MKNSLLLQIASLLSVLFMTFHLTSDTLHARAGSPEAGGSTLVGVPILALWLLGATVLAERRSGHIIMLVGALIAIAMPVMHTMSSGGMFHGVLANSSGPFMFVWTLHVLGLTGLFSFTLAVLGLLQMRQKP